MSKKALILMVIVSVFSAFPAHAAVIYSTWVCEDGEWENANNWNPAVVPDNNGTNSFVVTIDTSSYPYQVEVGLQQSHDVNKLDCYGNIDLEKWTSDWVELTVYDGLTNHGVLEVDEIEINGDVNNTAGASLELYNMDIVGNLYNQAGATMEVEKDVWVDVDDEDNGGYLENAGSIMVIPYCQLGAESHLNNLGTILLYDGTVSSDEIFDNNSTGIIKGFGIVHGGQLVRNKGQIYASGGSLAVVCFGSLINTGTLGNVPLSLLHIKSVEDVNNQGTIEVNAGGVAFDCNLINEANGVIKLLGGTLAATMITQRADANFAGFGGVTGNVQIDPDGLIKLTGPTNVVGDVNIPAGATLEISDGQTLITGHTVCDGTIHLIGGTVIFQGGCDCDGCNIINEAGTDRNHFDINADGIENFRDFAEFANNWLWQASWY